MTIKEMGPFIKDSQLYLYLKCCNSFDRMSNNECEKKRFFVAPIEEAFGIKLWVDFLKRIL
jgi:hypothetical protein